MAKTFDDGAEPTWGLYVDEQRRDMDSRKSIKVKLPIRQHIKLHALKLFSENNISQTVEAALDLYFERMRAAELHARAAVGAGSEQGVAGGAGSGVADGVHGSNAGNSSSVGGAPGNGPTLPVGNVPHGPGN